MRAMRKEARVPREGCGPYHPRGVATRRPPVQGWASTRAMRKEAHVPREGCAAMRITAEGFVHYEVRASVRPRGRRPGVERRSVQGLVSKQQAAARPKRASTTMLDTCMERVETCEKHATERHGPRCRCPKARQRKNAFCCSFIYWWRYMWWAHPSLFCLVPKGRKYTNAVPAKRNPFQDF